MAEPFVLFLACPFCSGPVTCRFDDWDDAGPFLPIVWACPHCERLHDLGEGPGRLTRVLKGHGYARRQHWRSGSPSSMPTTRARQVLELEVLFLRDARSPVMR